MFIIFPHRLFLAIYENSFKWLLSSLFLLSFVSVSLHKNVTSRNYAKSLALIYFKVVKLITQRFGNLKNGSAP